MRNKCLLFTSHPACGQRLGPGSALCWLPAWGLGNHWKTVLQHSCQVPELRTFSWDELHEYLVRTSGGRPVSRAPRVYRPVCEGLELHPQAEDPRQEVGLVALGTCLGSPVAR